MIANGSFLVYFLREGNPIYAILFEIVLIPMAVYFIQWFLKVLKNPLNADYRRTMNMNLISSTCLNIFFLIQIIS